MEFGKLARIDDVDWTLPEDSPLSLDYLKSLGPAGKTRFWVGAPAWSHKVWEGTVFPPRAKSSEYLHHYARFFNCIELNTTHYRIPTDEQTKKWKDQVGADFLFCPKMPQTISHSPGGMLDRDLIKQWLHFLETLAEHRGPCFMQFPPGFDYNRRAWLHQFLRQWPADLELALEFRHPSWFEGRQIRPSLVKYLQENGVGLVITDVAGRRDVVHTSISAPYTMLRFIGNDLHPSDAARAAVWAERLATWSRAGLQRVFFFVHEPDDIVTPQMTAVVVRELNERAGAGLDLARLAQDDQIGFGI